MPAHDWEDMHDTLTLGQQIGGWERRKCRNCGAVQELEREYAWMRQVSKRWLPLVGRCKPLKREVRVSNAGKLGHGEDRHDRDHAVENIKNGSGRTDLFKEPIHDRGDDREDEKNNE